MNVGLKPELERLIADEVQAGRSSGAEDFLNGAVYHYALARSLGEEYTLEEMDRFMAEGLEDFERGEVVDGGEAFWQLRANSAMRRQQA